VIGAIDETGQEKASEATAGVKRQYLGCAGRVANGINTVHLSYVREKTGHALAGARQWIPAEHIEDPMKSLVMGLPPDLRFRTKGQLAIDIPRPARQRRRDRRGQLANGGLGDLGLVSDSCRSYAARMMQPPRRTRRGFMTGPRGGRRGLAVPRGQRGPAAQRRRREIDARASARDMQIIRPRPARSRARAGRSRARGMQAGCLSFMVLLGLALVLARFILGRKSA
jgi:hypothetical protein